MNHPVCHEHFNQAFIILNHTSPLPFGCQGLFNSLSSYLSPSLSHSLTPRCPHKSFWSQKLILPSHKNSAHLIQMLSPSFCLSLSITHTNADPPLFTMLNQPHIKAYTRTHTQLHAHTHTHIFLFILAIFHFSLVRREQMTHQNF